MGAPTFFSIIHKKQDAYKCILLIFMREYPIRHSIPYAER